MPTPSFVPSWHELAYIAMIVDGGIKVKIIRIAEVKDLTGLSVSTINRRANDPKDDFPQCVQLGENSKGFYLEEITNWIDSLPRGFGSPPPCVLNRLTKNPDGDNTDLAVA